MSTDKLGATCTSSTACGGEGNLCVKPRASAASKVCASVCLDDAGCAPAYRSASLATGNTLSSRGCVKR